jgi:hypothetical protein
MRLPRITPIYTVEFILKSGATLDADFIHFNLNYDAEEINSMNFTADCKMFYINMADISVVRQVRQRRVIRWRNANNR